MKKPIIMSAFVAVVMLSACNKTPNSTKFSFSTIPVTVAKTSGVPSVYSALSDFPYLETPNLLDLTDAKVGDCYLAAFEINLSALNDSNHYVAENFTIQAEVPLITIARGDSVNDSYALTFDNSVSSSGVFHISNVLDKAFLAYYLKGAKDQKFAVEAIFVDKNPTNGSDVEVYIRAKKTEPIVEGTEGVTENLIVVDFAAVAEYYKAKGLTNITLTLKYKSGEDENGEQYASVLNKVPYKWAD